MPFSGVIFAKNNFDTCRVEISGSDTATLVLGLPANFGTNMVTKSAEESTEATATQVEVSADNIKLEKPESELRLRRQIDEQVRNCGIQDMVRPLLYSCSAQLVWILLITSFGLLKKYNNTQISAFSFLFLAEWYLQIDSRCTNQ